MTRTEDFFAICEEVVRTVEREASRVPDYSSCHRNPRQVQTKTSIGDVITQLDRTVETGLIERLMDIIPGSQVIGEESGKHGEGLLNWVIDPIDGSTNVLHGMKHAAVSVALCEGAIPKVGVVHNPFTAESYYAVAGAGAFSHTRQGGTADASHKPIKVSPNTQLEQSLLGFGLPYDRSKAPRIFSVAERAFARCQDLRRRGSAALDLVSVATGELDGYFELDLRVWDVAAAGLILQEAGGALSSWDGAALQWDSPERKLDVLATNGAIHDAMRGFLLE
ncbi:inositol monophosphatase family protein [Streptomyces sp. V1I6]|uniref:inositol monophosphatase family protein n=1 Tax=Streptomyces sp. V1I6 TaxID=3042273 RepID=UPI0027855C48|nr:inositol monophosphatase family protein [Streptomyces sp. V1I6]MDQ0845648.1 myo-inositol-1(or 4)-monophosphatase [Streptomyces sp. V1I6]